MPASPQPREGLLTLIEVSGKPRGPLLLNGVELFSFQCRLREVFFFFWWLTVMPFSSAFLSQVNLRLILVSGKTEDFTFSPNDSATDIAKHVFDNWPAGWEEEQVSSPSILRLIFQGRFLHGNVTLGALKLPPGRTTVMHLVARETLPEPNSHGQRNREKTTESNCCLLL
uniref:Ubiquitin-like protein 3 n=1 Tax=Gadus morhua TaxID=8049 RepID=A0A8C5FSB8_GADMO